MTVIPDGFEVTRSSIKTGVYPYGAWLVRYNDQYAGLWCAAPQTPKLCDSDQVEVRPPYNLVVQAIRGYEEQHP